MIHPTGLGRITAVITASALFGGCSVNPTGSFRDVEGRVASRTGKKLHWIRDGADAAAAQSAVRKLLSHRLNADSAAQVALLNNRRLQSAFEEIGIAQADYVQAGIPRNPQFAGHVDFSPAGKSYEYSAATELMNLLLLPLSKKIARSELEQTKMRVAAEVVSLVAETKTAFYNLQARQQMLSRLKLIVGTNEAAADLSKRQHDAGNISDLDLADQQALYTESRIDIAQTEAQIRRDRERLNRLMGVWGADTNWKLGDELPEIPSSEISLAKLESKALEQRFDVAMARRNVEAIGLSRGLRAKTRFLPVQLNAGVHGERESDSEGRRGPQIDLTLPIFDQGQAALAKLGAQYRQAQDDLEATAVEARSEVREARDMVTASRELARYYGQVLLPQRIQIVNQTQLQYNAMQRGPVDLLLAKERELNTERSYIEAWRDYWIARAELEMALKGGSPRGGSMRDGGGETSSQKNRGSQESQGGTNH